MSFFLKSGTTAITSENECLTGDKVELLKIKLIEPFKAKYVCVFMAHITLPHSTHREGLDTIMTQ